MSFIKDFIDKLFSRKNKMLEEGHTANYKSTSSRDKSWIISGYDNNNNNNNNNAQSKLDTDIHNFLQAYYSTIKSYPNSYYSNCTGLGYSALVRMKGKPLTEEEFYKNNYAEKLLLNKLISTNKYTVSAQGNNNYPGFYHVKSENYFRTRTEDLRRIYINCNNGNVSSLVHALLEYNTHPNFYLKFCSNYSSTKHTRGEKIVIYFDKSDVNYISQLLEFTQNKHPDLFEESDQTLPFLQSFNGIASISKEPTLDMYIDLHGNKIPSARSTNSRLAMILRESYNETVKEIARVCPDISFLLSEQYNEILGVKNFPYINHNYHDYLLNGMKAKMQILSRKNDLYIEGLFPQKQSLAQHYHNYDQQYYK